MWTNDYGLHEFNFTFDNGNKTEFLIFGKGDRMRQCSHTLSLNQVLSFKKKLVKKDNNGKWPGATIKQNNETWPWHTSDLEINGVPICDPNLNKFPKDKKQEFAEFLSKDGFIAGFTHISCDSMTVSLGLVIYRKS